MTQLNAERRRRNETVLDLNQGGTRDNWYATRVTAHGNLFSFSDNLTTMMFIVASDLHEAQRETHKFTFSPEYGGHCFYTLDAVQTVFVELFCTPKELNGESFSPRERRQPQYKQNLHHGSLC